MIHLNLIFSLQGDGGKNGEGEKTKRTWRNWETKTGRRKVSSLLKTRVKLSLNKKKRIKQTVHSVVRLSFVNWTISNMDILLGKSFNNILEDFGTVY